MKNITDSICNSLSSSQSKMKCRDEKMCHMWMQRPQVSWMHSSQIKTVQLL